MARDINRIHPLITELEKLWCEHTDLRFCQLVIDIFGIDSFYLEDEDAMKIIERNIKGYKNG